MLGQSLRLLLVAGLAGLAMAANQRDVAPAPATEQQTRVCRTDLRAHELPVFTSPAQVREIIANYETDRLGGSCGAEYAQAFGALKEVLAEREVLDDICGLQAYERIRAFHVKFMHFYVPELSREQLNAALKGPPKLEPIPPALGRFFVNFVKQANAACKQHMVARMRNEVLLDKQLVDDEDLAVLQQYKKESGRLGFMYELTKLGLSSYGRKRVDDLAKIEVVDLLAVAAHGPHGDLGRAPGHAPMSETTGKAANGLAKQLEVDDGTKLYVQVKFDDRLRRVKEACLKRFMPIYRELFLPVIRLNNLGYVDHTHTSLEDRELRDNESLAKWLEIIQTCEVLKDVEVLHDSSALQAVVGIIQDNSHLAGAHSSTGSVKILSRAEADELAARVANSHGGEVRPLYEPQTSHLEHQPVAFTPRLWLTEPAQCQREADLFRKDLKRVIKHKTSAARSWMQDLRFYIKNTWHVGKNQVLDKDQSTALGRFAAFAERHQGLIKGVAFVMSVIFITTVLVGR